MALEDARAAISGQLQELERLREGLSSSGDAVAGSLRFDRWKNRTLAMLQSKVSDTEADAFDQTYVPLVMGSGEVSYLEEQIQRHRASLATLIEEIDEHPEAFEYPDEHAPSLQALSSLQNSSEGINPRQVFVIHGRDEAARSALFDFLQDLDLHPIQWEELVRVTGKGNPHNAEVVAAAFDVAQAVIVLMTPDDECRLHPELWADDETESETTARSQPRPNVYLEAGMAMQAQPDRTIFVEIGRLRPASDLDGLNSIRMTGGIDPLIALAGRLEAAGCTVSRDNPDWTSLERFTQLEAMQRRAGQDPPQRSGTQVVAPQLKASLSASLHRRGKGYVVEVLNAGDVPLKGIEWTLPGDVDNWEVLDSVLPEYPIPSLEPGERVRAPIVITMGGPSAISLTLAGQTENGGEFRTTSTLSVYDVP